MENSLGCEGEKAESPEISQGARRIGESRADGGRVWSSGRRDREEGMCSPVLQRTETIGQMRVIYSHVPLTVGYSLGNLSFGDFVLVPTSQSALTPT